MEKQYAYLLVTRLHSCVKLFVSIRRESAPDTINIVKISNQSDETLYHRRHWCINLDLVRYLWVQVHA
jgi:hypothetical protein